MTGNLGCRDRCWNLCGHVEAPLLLYCLISQMCLASRIALSYTLDLRLQNRVAMRLRCQFWVPGSAPKLYHGSPSLPQVYGYERLSSKAFIIKRLDQ